MMCGSLAGRDVEGMIYLNWQTKPNQTLPNHQLPEAAVACGACGPGRDGVRGAEQAATTSAAKVHPSPREGGAKSEL